MTVAGKATAVFIYRGEFMKEKSEKITAKQEIFIRELLKGKSQRKAYRAAFPSSVNWKDSTVDSKASTLFNSGKIQERYQLIKQELDNKAIMHRTDRMITLSKIAEREAEDTGCRIRAIDVLNKMDGDYIQRVEVSTPDDSSLKEMEEYFASRKEKNT